MSSDSHYSAKVPIILYFVLAFTFPSPAQIQFYAYELNLHLNILLPKVST